MGSFHQTFLSYSSLPSGLRKMLLLQLSLVVLMALSHPVAGSDQRRLRSPEQTKIDLKPSGSGSGTERRKRQTIWGGLAGRAVGYPGSIDPILSNPQIADSVDALTGTFRIPDAVLSEGRRVQARRQEERRQNILQERQNESQ